MNCKDSNKLNFIFEFATNKLLIFKIKFLVFRDFLFVLNGLVKVRILYLIIILW